MSAISLRINSEAVIENGARYQLKRTEDCGNLSSSPLERTYAIRLGIHSEAGWIHSLRQDLCIHRIHRGD
jgi:hypothetical protein